MVLHLRDADLNEHTTRQPHHSFFTRAVDVTLTSVLLLSTAGDVVLPS